jgi:hypothetical protein
MSGVTHELVDTPGQRIFGTAVMRAGIAFFDGVFHRIILQGFSMTGICPSLHRKP